MVNIIKAELEDINLLDFVDFGGVTVRVVDADAGPGLFVDEGFCLGFAEDEEFAVGGDDVGHGLFPIGCYYFTTCSKYVGIVRKVRM